MTVISGVLFCPSKSRFYADPHCCPLSHSSKEPSLPEPQEPNLSCLQPAAGVRPKPAAEEPGPSRAVGSSHPRKDEEDISPAAPDPVDQNTKLLSGAEAPVPLQEENGAEEDIREMSVLSQTETVHLPEHIAVLREATSESTAAEEHPDVKVEKETEPGEDVSPGRSVVPWPQPSPVLEGPSEEKLLLARIRQMAEDVEDSEESAAPVPVPRTKKRLVPSESDFELPPTPPSRPKAEAAARPGLWVDVSRWNTNEKTPFEGLTVPPTASPDQRISRAAVLEEDQDGTLGSLRQLPVLTADCSGEPELHSAALSLDQEGEEVQTGALEDL